MDMNTKQEEITCQFCKTDIRAFVHYLDGENDDIKTEELLIVGFQTTQWFGEDAGLETKTHIAPLYSPSLTVPCWPSGLTRLLKQTGPSRKGWCSLWKLGLSALRLKLHLWAYR